MCNVYDSRLETRDSSSLFHCMESICFSPHPHHINPYWNWIIITRLMIIISTMDNGLWIWLRIGIIKQYQIYYPYWVWSVECWMWSVEQTPRSVMFCIISQSPYKWINTWMNFQVIIIKTLLPAQHSLTI